MSRETTWDIFPHPACIFKHVQFLSGIIAIDRVSGFSNVKTGTLVAVNNAFARKITK